MLHELQAKDRRGLEYWGHAASFLPIEDYRYYLPLMKSFEDPKMVWQKRRHEKYGHLMAPVLERIQKEGPLGSRDFDPPPGVKRGAWWDWKPTKNALELLFWRGDLMVRERRNFQRIYDLTERVLPNHIDTTFPSESELGRFFARRALAAYGIAQEKEIKNHIHAADKKILSKSLLELVEDDEVVQLEIAGKAKPTYYALASTLQKSSRLKKNHSSVAILSPFDNLIIQRDRTNRLFDFDYTLECYLPAPKRTYGYFVLPILWDERLVGRLDPKADHTTSTLILRNLVFEKTFQDFESFLPAFASKLLAFAEFNRCRRIKVDKVKPGMVKRELTRTLKEARSQNL
jgi:uncharacterized protein YcaQ